MDIYHEPSGSMNQWSFLEKNKTFLFGLTLLIIGFVSYCFVKGYISFNKNDGLIINTVSNKAEKIVTLTGILLNATTNMPLSIREVSVMEESKNSYADYDAEKGRFTITNVKVPPNKKITLLVTFEDGQISPLDEIDLEQEEEAIYIRKEKTYNLKILRVKPLSSTLEELEEEPEDYDKPLGLAWNDEDRSVEYKEAVVVTESTALNLRSEPNTTSSSRVVYKIPQGKTVKVLGQDDELLNIEGRSGYWVLVQYGSYEGYVFDGYLRYK